MELSRRLGANVQQRLGRKERTEPALRVQGQAAVLAKTGQLTGSLVVPNAAASIDLLVDLRANRIDCSATILAPTEGRTLTRINWLLKQLKEAPRDLMVTAASVRARDSGPCHPLHVLEENPMLLVENPQAEIKSFTITLSHPAGTKRGQGRGSFVASVTQLVDRFYVEVIQYLKVWSAPPPKPKAPPKADAQEVAPPHLDGAQIENQGDDGPVPDWPSTIDDPPGETPAPPPAAPSPYGPSMETTAGGERIDA
jgi:hypothetical protein